MRIAYIVEGDPLNRRLWSGTVTAAYTALSKKYDVEAVDISKRSHLLDAVYKIFGKMVRLFTGKRFMHSFGRWAAKRDSRAVDRYLAGRDDIDLVFCAAKSGSIAYVKTDKRIVYLTDATFDSMCDYYGYMSNLAPVTIRSGNEIERRAIENSDVVICASEWAKESVVSVYGASKNKVFVIPFGANISDPTSQSSPTDSFNILFCGVEWERKGGTLAVEAFRELKKENKNCKLYLVGCEPQCDVSDEDIIKVGFLNKNVPEEKQRLDNIYATASCLLLPTIAEAAGIVFAEASAHGIPSVTHDTGGVGTYVIDGVNGFKLALGSSAVDFSCVLSKIINDNKLYSTLRNGCLELYESRFNWNSWLESFSSIVEKEMK